MSSYAGPPVEKIYAPYFLGTLLATAFYSIMCMQVFRYFVHYRKDRLFLKVLVGFVWVMNTLHEAMTISAVYKQLMGGLRSPLASLNGHPELFFKPFLTSLVAVPVQGFFAYRIYIFTKRNFIPPLLWFTSGIIQIVATIIYVAKGLYISDGTIKTVPVTQLSRYPFRFLQTLTIPVAVTLDILIAIAMTVLLVREYGSTQLPKTSRMLQRLIIFTVNTGVWSAAFALTSLILVYAFPGTSFSFVGSTAVCSVYSNTLLANLNARESLRDTPNSSRGGTDTYGFALSTLPVSTAKPREECRTLFGAGKAAGADDWKTAEVDP